MLGKLRLEARQPLRVGARLARQQLPACAQRRLIAIAVLRVPRVEREDEPIEEAPPVPRALDEQPVHRRGQPQHRQPVRSEEHTSELQSLMRISYAVFCLNNKKK